MLISAGTVSPDFLKRAYGKPPGGLMPHCEAYRTSFHWLADCAFVAALSYIYVCRVVSRAAVPAETQGGELAVAAVEYS
jgi:hypothetical protein